MKKSLLALAALSAIAGAAQAQSSVTVYGILDAGYVGANTSYVANGVASKGTASAFTGQGAESTSRLGFKGNEDLGGGMSAFFTIEMGLNPDSNQAISSSSTQNRQSFVGLKKNGLGDFAVGTQYTPIFNAVGKTDPGQTNNMVGSIIYPRSGFNNTATAAGITGTTSGNDNNLAFTVRTAQTLTLNTDVFAGFQGHASYTLNNSNTNQTATVSGTGVPGASTGGTVTGGTNNQTGWGLGLDYALDKFFVTGAYQSYSSTNPYSYTAASSSTATPAEAVGGVTIYGVNGANTLGTNVKDNQGYVAATYDFGILKAYANWVTRKATDSINPDYYAKRSGEQIGVRSFITPTIEGWASAGLGRYQAYGTGQPTANFNAWQLGANYWLSKRTNLYAIVGAENTSNYATVSATGATTGENSANVNAYAVGVKHTF